MTMSVVRKIVFLIVLVLAVLIFIYRQLIGYGLSQLAGQCSIVYHSRPLDEVLNDPDFPDSLKGRLQYIQKVRAFAIDSLGLTESRNYTTVYDQKGKPLLMVLTASEPYRIKAYTWKFPWLGEVPYKGFFDFELGEVEEKKLKQEGYDTDLGEVSAWSTLGWFKDPILTGMLDRTEGQLAELIIHELTHSTLYVKNNVDFNENLASFVGEQGAISFLRSFYGDSSEQLRNYRNRLDDYTIFSRYMVASTSKLDSLYLLVQNESKTIKDSVKDNAMTDLVNGIGQLPFHEQSRYARVFRKRKPNNAYLLNFVRYDAQKDSLEELFRTKYHSDFRSFLSSMKSFYNK